MISVDNEQIPRLVAQVLAFVKERDLSTEVCRGTAVALED